MRDKKRKERCWLVKKRKEMKLREKKHEREREKGR